MEFPVVTAKLLLRKTHMKLGFNGVTHLPKVSKINLSQNPVPEAKTEQPFQGLPRGTVWFVAHQVVKAVHLCPQVRREPVGEKDQLGGEGVGQDPPPE